MNEGTREATVGIITTIIVLIVFIIFGVKLKNGYHERLEKEKQHRIDHGEIEHEHEHNGKKYRHIHD